MGTFRARLRDPFAERPGDQMMVRSGDVRGASVIHVFLIQLKNILDLFLQVTQDFIVNSTGEKFSEQYSDKKNNEERGMMTSGSIIKIWLEGLW